MIYRIQRLESDQGGFSGGRFVDLSEEKLEIIKRGLACYANTLPDPVKQVEELRAEMESL